MKSEKKEKVNIKNQIAISEGHPLRNIFGRMLLEESVSKKLSNSLYELIAKSTFAEENIDEIILLAFKNVHGMERISIYLYDSMVKTINPYMLYKLSEEKLIHEHIASSPVYTKSLNLDSDTPLGVYWCKEDGLTYKFNLIPGDFNVDKIKLNERDIPYGGPCGIILPLLFQKKLIGLLEGTGDKLRFDGDKSKEPFNLMLYMASIARIVATHIELDTDPLTGLKTRRHFDITLHKYINRNIRNGSTFSLIYIDGDHFKKINDEYGHSAGDTVLRFIARQIFLSTREGECDAFRIGGEEFAIIVNVGLDAAQEISKRISENIKK